MRGVSGRLGLPEGLPPSPVPFQAFILTCDRVRSNLARHERATSSDTPNHSVSVDRRGFRGVRLPLFLCGGSARLDHCGGGLNGLCRTILALGRVHQCPETGQLKLMPRRDSAEAVQRFSVTAGYISTPDVLKRLRTHGGVVHCVRDRGVG